MADIINLRNARKQKARAANEEQAAQNRLLFGRSKEEQLRLRKQKSLADKHIDGHKRDEPEQP